MQERAKRAAHGAKRQRDPSFSQRSQRNRWIKFHTVVLDHAVAEHPLEQRDTGIKDHAVAEYPRKFPRSQQTRLWKTTALAQDQRLRCSRVLHSSAGVTTRNPRPCKLPQDGAGGTDQKRSRTQSSTKVTRQGR